MKNKPGVLKILLPVFLLLTVASGAMLLLAPFGLSAINTGTNGFGPFDFRFTYTPDNLMTVLSHFSGSKREAYSAFFTADYIFAATAFFPMLFIPIMIYRKNDAHYLLFRSAVFSAITSTVFNILENAMLMSIVYSSPVFTDRDANLASGFTTIKWVLLGIWAVSTILLAVTTLITVLRSQNKRHRFS